jgi:SpoVK/Ycf46/Vps4 family AAA+-type ATPase
VNFDTSAVYDRYIGETEKGIRKVFQGAEGLAPRVLWIDESEKVFAGREPDSASADAGVSSRLLAAFLSWMQGPQGSSVCRGDVQQRNRASAGTDSQGALRRALLFC